MIKIGVLGAGGRMGQAIIAEVLASADVWLAGGVERAQHPLVGREIGDGLVVGANAGPLARKADVLIDFSSPLALEEHLRAAEESRTPILVGTTGLQPAHHAAIESLPQLNASRTGLPSSARRLRTSALVPWLRITVVISATSFRWCG